MCIMVKLVYASPAVSIMTLLVLYQLSAVHYGSIGFVPAQY